MTDQQRKFRNDAHLANLPYVFRRKAAAIIAALEGWGWRPFINESLRTKEHQAQLFAEGKTQTMDSKHLPQAGGYAHAVDLVCDGILWDDKQPGFVPFAKMQANAARSFGCRSGYFFKGYHPVVGDFAHIEYKP